MRYSCCVIKYVSNTQCGNFGILLPQIFFLQFRFRPQDGKKKKKGKLRKEDISLPTNFQHISHVGWDPNRGFDLGM